MAGRFGTQLQSLLHQLGVKNAVLARALQYDVSYISKWIGGRTLPSEKNASTICLRIAQELSAIPGAARMLDFAADDATQAQLCEQLYRMLLDACTQDRSAETSQETVVTASPLLPEDALLDAVGYQTLLHQDEADVIFAVDYFALQNEHRLRLSAIEDGHFSLQEKLPDTDFRMVISLPDEQRQHDVVYDAISLIHMLTGLSQTRFSLYHDVLAQDRLMLAVRSQYYAAAMHMGGKGQWGAFVREDDAARADVMYQALDARLGSDSLVFRRTDMAEMLLNHEYIQSIISTRIRWLLGHLTELVLPDDVFDACLADWAANRTDDRTEALRAEMQRVHGLTRSVLETCNVSIMIYDSSFSDLAITGEIDFFNQPMRLNAAQRVRVMEHLGQLADKTRAIRIIHGGFSADFKYITNPCMFMSDTLCYLRLENGTYTDNLLILNDLTIKQLFDRFFCQVWDHREDVVIESQERVMELLRHYELSVRMMVEAGGNLSF